MSNPVKLFHPKLNAHRGIGVDIDETLINGPCSHLLQRWIHDHHQDVELHLITFRNGDHFNEVESDVKNAGLTLDMFRGVHGIPVHIGQPFWDIASRTGIREYSEHAKWLRTLNYMKIKVEDYDLLHQNTAMWKGAKCAELGLSALVDDLEHMVALGCNHHKVEWINALTLWDLENA
jgi:hypothetical protein